MRSDVGILVTVAVTLLFAGLSAAEARPGQRTVATPPVLRATQTAGVPAEPAQTRPIRHWIFAPGRYTNDPETGKRVDQFEKIAPVSRIPNDLYYSPSGPHPYGPEYGYNRLYQLPGIAPIPYHLPGLHSLPALPIGPALPW